MKVVGFGCGPWRWYRGVGKIHMNKGSIGEERGGKEIDRCLLVIWHTGYSLLCPCEDRLYLIYIPETCKGTLAAMPT
jgi:hypothetical protein